VVGAEDCSLAVRRLGDGASQQRVEGHGPLEVFPKRLLEHDAAACRETGIAERRHRRGV
jgi:hypothetical protein